MRDVNRVITQQAARCKTMTMRRLEGHSAHIIGAAESIMVRRICAWGHCTNTSDTRKNRYNEETMKDIDYFSFPDPSTKLEDCRIWIKACARIHEQLNLDKVAADSKKLLKNRSYFVCSAHFPERKPTLAFPYPHLCQQLPSERMPSARKRTATQDRASQPATPSSG